MNRKSIQQKLSLAIASIAVVMGISACKTPKQQSDMQVINLTPNVKFLFNKTGECYVKTTQKISEKDFQDLTGFGGVMWVSIINEDGQ